MSKIDSNEIAERHGKVVGQDYHRGAAAEVSNIDEAARTVQFSFASELPVERWGYVEVLEMSKKAADLGRLKSGGALLSDHNHGKQIGRVMDAWIGDDKRGHCIVKFSRRAAAEEEFQDVIDGVRTNVSFGYRIKKYETEKGEGGSPDKITATRWEAFEISLVSVPADPTVGVGRAQDAEQPEDTPEAGEQRSETVIEPASDEEAENTEEKRGSIEVMDKNNQGQPQTPAMTREDEILEFGRKFGADERMVKSFALDPNKSVEDLRKALAEQYRADEPTTAAPQRSIADLDLTPREIKQYSISRAILAQADGNWSQAGFERECHEAITARGLQPQKGGFFVPTDVQNGGKRDLSVGGGLTTGGALVGTDHMPQSFIEILRSKMKMVGLGVQVISDLVGNPSVPRQDGAATGYWVTEGTAPNESDQVFGQLGMSPKTVGAVTEFTRQLLVQSAPSVDQLVNRDIAAVLARTIDKAIISGTGASGQPRGILNTTGVSEVAMAGTSFAWEDAVEFETEIAEADAPEAIAWLARPSVMGALKTRLKVAGSNFPIYLIEGGQMNGYKFATTTQMPNAETLLFGDFTTIILGEWGVLEIEANRLGTTFRSGNIEVRGLHMVDVAVRYPQALKKLTAFA